MGIKDLFNENSTGVVPTTSIEEEVVRNTPELESVENVKEQRKRIERYIPPLDFSDPSNFARYGSAESYYQDAISRIYNQYPYDGSEREIQEFLNESNYVDLHIYEDQYPRTTGYAIFSADGWGALSSPGALTGGYGLSSIPEYIKVIGGPHTSSGGIPTGDLRKAFGEPTNRTSPNANIYDNDIYGTADVNTLDRVGSRESNLKYKLSNGVSTEFWLNKGTDPTGSDVAATATITITAFAELNAGDKINLIATDGTNYDFEQGDQSSVNGTFEATTSNDQTATNLMNVINTSSGPAGTRFTATVDGAVVTVTQAIVGNPGNTTVTLTDSGTAGMTKTDFTGGTGLSYTKQVIFDLWNGEASSSAGYGRLLVGYSGSFDGTNPLYAHIASGSNAWDMTFGGSTTTTASLKDTWNHIGFTFSTSSVDARLETKFYLNGNLKETQTNTSLTSFGEVTGSLNGFIGALQTSPSGGAFHGTTMAGYGKLSGSLDEFRFWKNKRTERDIQRNWWTQVRGGTNTDISNADLGFYFKFNEGITGTSSIDSAVLDYSGRISNGVWTGYPSSNARNVGSAINLSTATVSGTTEFKDPIIYSEHADVVSLYNTYSDSGSVHDHANVSSILDSLPAWIIEEDDAKGSGELKKLAQIVGSYFDTLHLQVEHLPKIAEVGYQTASAKPVPFSDRLLASFGLHAPETFVEASILEKFANRRDDRGYSLDINDVKNQVYQNIYNNLNFIYKSKGTEKSFRNLIRCYGIDEEVIKLNAYGNNSTFKFEDTYSDATVRKNYIDFNHTNRFDGIVYQNSSSNSETAGITYISGTNVNFANTAEAEIIFPKKMELSNPQYFLTPFVSASLFGSHTAKAISSDFSWESTAGNDYGFQIYFIKTAEESKDGKFLLTTRTGDFTLTSSVYADVYDNQKWNLSVRTKDAKYPYAAGVTGSSLNNDIRIEFSGYNIELGVVKNSFQLTASSLANEYLSSTRRYYAGADRTDTVGAVVTKTDTRASSIRHYAHYLEDSVLLAHAKDPTNFGVGRANKNIIFSANSASLGIDNIDLPEYASLAMHWDFSQVTTSDAAGAFETDDASSGSVSLQTRYSSDGNFSHIVANQYAGRGYFPSALSSVSIVDKNYVPASKQRLPEVVNSSDAVNVLTQDDDLYPSDPAVSQTFFAFEKSMFGVISQEMISTMATVVEFNNLVGEMTNKYRAGYKDFTRLRTLFFEKIENNPDLDKFIDYYKWIDNSLSVMIQQLVPASADVADEIRTVVESHIFERSKYRHKMPLLDYKGNARWGGDELLLEARAFGINELDYNWRTAHAPVRQHHIDADQSTSSRWWKERAERTSTAFGTAALADSARQSINDIILTFNSASYKGKFSTADGTIYDGSTYALNRFASPVKLTVGTNREISSGYNFPARQKPESVTVTLKPGDATTLNVSTESFKDIDVGEVGDPILTIKRPFITKTVGVLGGSKIHSPVGQFSSSLGTTEFAGLHTDAYGDHYETPMQGPFSQEHIGGYQHRHTALNTGADAATNRQEAWEIAGGDTFTTRNSMHHPPAYSNYQRDERAKRPVNLKNIQSVTGTAILGNYHNIYEVVQTSGRKGNNSEFVKSEGFGSSSTVSAFIDSANDHAKPARTKRAHVFVNRFSAPGGPETAGDALGGPFLDLESAEFSPYNEMNSRNLTVRKPLQELLTEHNEQFGLRLGSTTIGAIHKTNRNPLKRIEKTGATGLFVTTASVFDNYYVQHVIPQSDLQYTWITASHSGGLHSETVAFGYFPANGIVSTSAGLVAASSFVSASSAGSKYTGGNMIVSWGIGEGYASTPTDYAGINTNIIMPISASDFTIGYPLDSNVLNYYNYSDIGKFVTNTENYNSFVTKIGTGAKATSAVLHSLNHILSHRQGPYGHPTWKQLRVGQGPLGRYYRKNNLYTHTSFNDDLLETEFANASENDIIQPKRGDTFIVSQSVVTSKYHPIKQELLVVAGEDRGKSLAQPLMVMSSYGNNVVYFDNPDFANKMGIKIKKGFSAYNQIKNLYLDGALENPSSPVIGVNRVIYTETVWPSIKNAYTNKVRGRTDFTNNFWRDNRIDRTTLAATKKPTNTAGLPIDQSAWSLDAHENFPDSKTFNVAPASTAGTASATVAGRRAGELQNEYVHVHHGNIEKSYAGALYARKHLHPATASVSPAWGFAIPSSEIVSEGRLKGPSRLELLSFNSLTIGNAKWEAGDHAGAYEGTSSIFVKKPVNPFYDSYDEYFTDIKSKGKDYSIIPEFRITEHLEFYRNQGNDYLSENEKMFSIAQVPSGTTLPQNSAENDFFKVFTNSDFMKHFSVVRQDHEGVLDPHVLRLKCKAIKKFIPYDGFYPAERTTELVRQFQDSYASHVSFVTGTAADYQVTPDGAVSQYTRNFIKPLFAPGILYNTIKSGLAVDYPIMTGSFAIANDIEVWDDYLSGSGGGALANVTENSIKQIISSGSATIYSNSTPRSRGGGTFPVGGHGGGWDKRIPFEALLEPEKYMAGININDDEPSGLARIDATVKWSGEGDSIYSNMAHNFFAESANFFLEGGKTTGISSLPETSFGSVTPGEIYGMRVKLWRSMDKGKITSGSWGDFPVPQNTREFTTSSVVMPGGGGMVDLSGLATTKFTDYTAKENFTMYSRPSAFGPALGVHMSSTSSFSGSLHDFGARNGIYGSHTPPYYDGESWIDLIFFPQGLEVNQTAKSCSFSFRTDADLNPYQPTMAEIFSKPNAAVFSTDQNEVPLGGTYMRKWRYDQEELKREPSSSYGRKKFRPQDNPGATTWYGPGAGPWVNRWAMQGDASLNIFDHETDGADKKWRIQTKFETPMLNFNKVSVASGTLSIQDITSSNASLPRGMWHQFGRLPLEGEGVYMQITDIPTDWLETHPSANLQWDMGGQFNVYNVTPRVDVNAGNATTRGQIGHGSVEQNFSGYSIPLGGNVTGSGANPPIKSLVDLCGFNTDPVRIGEISDSTSIHEAIVAVPFIEEEGERKFFTIYDPSPHPWDLILDVAEVATATGASTGITGQTIINQVEAMERYVFPPTLDFVKNTSIDPFAMYIFEFEHKFSKDDLSHMWQNLPPKVGRRPSPATSIIEHKLMASELMGDWETYKASLEAGANKEDSDFFSGINDKVQWMVFKVKQRAKTNYYDALTGKEEEALASNIPSYTHNWPYDFCSIIELAKLDSEVQLGGEEEPTVMGQILVDGPGEVAAMEDPSATGAPSANSPVLLGGGY